MSSSGFARAFPCILLFLLLICSCAEVSSQSGAACATRLSSPSPIPQFCVVAPNVLWRGARPDKQSAWLIQQGVRTIVNLELILDDKAALGHATLADTKTYEVGYFRIHDWEPLPILAPAVVDGHVAHFLAIVSQQPKPVYVHCRSGENRTGVMVAAYRVIVEGATAEEAVEEMGRYRGYWFETDSSYIRGLAAVRREQILRKVKEWLPKLKKDAHVVCTNRNCSVTDR